MFNGDFISYHVCGGGCQSAYLSKFNVLLINGIDRNAWFASSWLIILIILHLVSNNSGHGIDRNAWFANWIIILNFYTFGFKQ